MPAGQTYLRSEVALLYAKEEVTYATDPTLAAENTVIAQDLTVARYAGDTIQTNEGRPHLGAREVAIVNKSRPISFGCAHGINSGSPGDAAKVGPLIKACGSSETIVATTSVTYAPITDLADITSAYLRAFFNRNTYDAPGSLGTWGITFQVDQFFMLNFEMLGLYVPPVDMAMGTEDRTGWDLIKPVDATTVTTFTIDGNSYPLRNLEFTAGQNNVKMNTAGGAGAESVALVGRESQIVATFNTVDITTVNWEQHADDLDKLAVVCAHGTTAGEINTLTAPTCQISAIESGEEDGVLTTTLTMACLPTSAGNDEWSFVQT